MMYKFIISFFIFSIYFGHLDTGITPFFISKIAITLLLLTAIISDFRDYFNFSNLTKILLFLLLFISIRNFFYYSTEISFINLEFLLIILCIESISTLIRNNRINFNKIVNYTILFSALVGLYLILGFGDNSWDNRHTIDGQNQNLLAVNMSIGIIFCLIKFKKSKIKILLFISLFIMLAAITMTGSRSGFIISLLGALGVLKRYFSFVQLNKKLLYSFLIILFITILGLIFFYSENILLSRFLENPSWDLSGRDAYWLAMPSWVEDNWLFGIGEAGLYSYSMFTYGSALNPHNLYVKIFVEAGLIGLLIVSLLIRELFILKNISKNNLYIIPGILVFLALSLVAHPLTTMSMWLLFIPCVVLTKINRQKKFNEL